LAGRISQAVIQSQRDDTEDEKQEHREHREGTERFIIFSIFLRDGSVFHRVTLFSKKLIADS
jgi:hypothetical protein